MKLFLIGIGYLLYWPTVLFFAFTLFRFRLKPLLPHIVFSSLLLTTLSVFMQNIHLVYLLSIVNVLGFIFCLWVIFRINLIHSFIMVFISFLVVVVTEWGIEVVLPFTSIRFVTEDNMYSFLFAGIILCLFNVFYTLILRKYRFGFSFVVRPRNRAAQTEPRFRGDTLLGISLALGFIIAVLASLAFFLYPNTLIYLSIIILVVVAILLRISYRWEMVD